MGFSSQNDFINKSYTLGKLQSINWYKALGATQAFTIGRWYCLGYLSGYPYLSRFGERMLNGWFVGGSGTTPPNWTALPTGWTWTFNSNNQGYNSLVKTAGSANSIVATGTLNVVAGGTYGVEIWVVANAASTLAISIGGTSIGTVSTAAGQYHFVGTAINSTDLTITATNTTTASINGCSVVLFGMGIPLFDSDLGALFFGGNVNPATKHIVSSYIMTTSPASGFMPGVWKLVDVLMSYPVNMNTSSVQTLTPIGGNYSVAFQNGAGAWTYGSGWAYSSATTVTASSASGSLTLPIVNFSAGNTGGPVYHAVNATTGLPYTYTYNITFTISSLTGSGSITFGIGGAITTMVLANGNYTNFITPINSTAGITFSTTGVNSFSLSNLSVTVSLPRYSNGVGVRPMLCWHSGGWQLASNATSAVAHNIQMTYTNSSNTIGQSLPTIISGLSGAVPAMGHIDHSGTAVNNFGPYLPLSSGDSGVQSVQSFQISAATGTNNYAELILCKELFTLPTSTPASLFAAAAERDFLNQVRTLPNIQDGANLQWVFFAGAGTAASLVASGNFKYSWG